MFVCLLEKTFSTREKKEIVIKKATTKDEKIVSEMAKKNAKQALSISDRGYVLVTGQNKFEGSGNELLNDPEVRRSFLGA